MAEGVGEMPWLLDEVVRLAAVSFYKLNPFQNSQLLLGSLSHYKLALLHQDPYFPPPHLRT